jgi:MFS family permease
VKQSKATMLIVFVTVFIDLLGFGIVIPLLPRYGELFGASKPVLGCLMASFSAMQFLFAPLWGMLSDRIGRRPVLLIGLLGSTLSYLLFGVASGLQSTDVWLGLSPLGWMFVTRITAGISGATIATAQAVIADSTGASGRGKGMAMIGAAFGIGFTFGPLIGAACLAATDSLALPGYVAAVLSGCAFLLACLKLPETRTHDVEAGVHRSWLNVKLIARYLKNPAYALILSAMFITIFGFAQLEATLSLLTDELGYDLRENYLVYAYIGVILAVGQGLIVRRLLPVVGERRMALAGSGLMTGGFFLVGGTAFGWPWLPPAGIWLILPVIVLGFSALNPSLQAMLSLAASRDEQGAVLGTGQSLSSLARIFGPLIGVSLMKYSVSLPYFLGAVLIALGSGLILMLRAPSHGATE